MCFADYWLDADGDQVLFDLKERLERRPASFLLLARSESTMYPANCKQFFPMVRKLPRSDVFRE